MTKLDEKISATIKKYSMDCLSGTVILGVSGGADSMCMLHFFNNLSRTERFNIICAHINHGIRGKEADADEEFVRSYCEKNGIEFRSARYNVPEIAAETGESEELCGRRLRYEFFASIDKTAKIATAHNGDDCIETFLFNLARGTGLGGLAGIPPVRDNIVRPLIDCSRAEIEEYLAYYGVDYVTDSTNSSDAYTRNKIRHKIVPVLKEINPNFLSVFKNCTQNISITNDFVSFKAQELYSKAKFGEKFDVSVLNEADEVIRNNALMKICTYYGAEDVSNVHIKLLSENLSGGAVVLHGNIHLASDGKYLFRKSEKQAEDEILEPITDFNKVYHFSGCDLILSSVDKSEINDYNTRKLGDLYFADREKLSNAVFRSRKEGDRFHPVNSVHSKSLKNLFKEKNITPESRRGVPFIANGENVLWINGVGVSHYARVDENTKNAVIITVRKVENNGNA